MARRVHTPSPVLLKKNGAEGARLPTIPSILLGFFSQEVGFRWRQMGMTLRGSGVTPVIRSWSAERSGAAQGSPPPCGIGLSSLGKIWLTPGKEINPPSSNGYKDRNSEIKTRCLCSLHRERPDSVACTCVKPRWEKHSNGDRTGAQ